MAGDRRNTGQLVDRFLIAVLGQGFEMDPARGLELPLTLGPLQREMRLGEDDQVVDEALIKLAVWFDLIVNWAA